jgi:hypothetical protein
MKIFLDPQSMGCTVWFYNGNCNMQVIPGPIDKVCAKIKEYVIHEEYDGDGNYARVQSAKIYLDGAGLGAHYAYWFKENGVKVHKTSYKQMIK